MKTKLFLSGLIALLSFGLVVTGCSGEIDVPVLPSFTVTFNADGGEPAPDPQTIKLGSPVIEPPPMSKNFHTFIGWFTDDETFLDKWDFDTPVTGIITLYAEWEQGYRVNFITNSNSTVPDQVLEEDGDELEEPDPPPIRNGYSLEGWYTGANFTTKWDFDKNEVTGPMTLYARWVIPFDTDGDFPKGFFTGTTGLGTTGNVNDVFRYPEHDFGYDDTKEAFWIENAKVGSGQFSFFLFEYPEGIDLSQKKDMSVEMAVENEDLANDMPFLFVRFFSGDTNLGQTRLWGISEGRKEHEMAENPGNFVTVDTSEFPISNPWNNPYVPDVDMQNVTKILFYIQHGSVEDVNGKTYIKNINFYDGFIVRFNTNRGTAVSDQIIKAGDKLNSVSTTRGGYTFDGWYRNAGFTIKWDLDDAVTDDTVTFGGPMILYARWVIPATLGGITTPSKFYISNDNGSWLNNSDHDFGYDDTKEAFWIQNAKISNGYWTFIIFEYPAEGISVSNYSSVSLEMAAENADLANDLQFLYLRFYNDNLPSAGFLNIVGQTSVMGITQGNNQVPNMAANPGTFYTLPDVSVPFNVPGPVTRIMFFIGHEPGTGDKNGKLYFKNITFK